MKRTARMLSWLLVLCLVVGLAPVSALAADGEKAIQLGTSVIKDPTETTTVQGKHYEPASYVYFGSNGGTPIQWRVLDADKNNAGSDGMFLLSEYLLASGIQFEAAWNSDDQDGQTNPNEWQNSDAQVWCSNSLNTYFSTQEQNVMLAVDKTDSTENSLYAIEWNGSSLSKDKDKLFFLSVRELADYVGNYDYAPGLIAKDGENGSAGVWWLRSPSADGSNESGVVDSDGAVNDYNVYIRLGGSARF